jgi:membrane protein
VSVTAVSAAEWGIRRITRRCVRLLTGLEQHEIAIVLKETLSEWSNDNAPRLGASLAFYTLLSLAPLLLIVVAVAALAYGQDAARGQLVWEICGLVGAGRARAIQDLLQSAYKPGPSLMATAFGVLTLALGATSVVVELRDALNTIWHVPPVPAKRAFAGLVQLLRERLFSFGLVLGGGLLLLLSLTMNAGIAALAKVLGPYLPASEFMLQAGTFALSFLAIAFLFAAIYKIVPDVPLCWGDVIVGSCVTALLLEIGKQLIGQYLGRSTFGSAYGAAGSIVILLVWVYYSAQLFFLGAEFTKVYTKIRISSGRRALIGFRRIPAHSARADAGDPFCGNQSGAGDGNRTDDSRGVFHDS